jgi:hypothetical protein
MASGQLQAPAALTPKEESRYLWTEDYLGPKPGLHTEAKTGLRAHALNGCPVGT